MLPRSPWRPKSCSPPVSTRSDEDPSASMRQDGIDENVLADEGRWGLGKA